MVVVCTLAVALAGAASQPGDEAAAPRYTLGVGDVLKVTTFQHDEISGEFPVEEDGTITFPLLGKVKVLGLSPSEAAAELERLLEKDYYVDVQVQAEVKEYRSRPVTVLGEVQNPGTYYLRGPTTVAQIIAEAGGLKPTAGATVEVRREETENGVPVQKVYSFSCEALGTGQIAGFTLRAGDIVSVSAKELYFVTGEVARPGQYELEPGLTLMQAISQAGGLGKFASQAVELHRGSGEAKRILTFDLGRIRRGKEPDPEIRPGDVIIVKRRFF